MKRFLLPAFLTILCAVDGATATFSVATFQSDATPPLGAPLCGGAVEPVKRVADPLSARGIVFFPENDKPVVLCAVDWVGIGNDGYREWREALAAAAKTDVSRVSVSVLHQHDTPMCDFTGELLLSNHGRGGLTMDVVHARKAIADAAAALKASLSTRREVTDIATGEGIVEKVASNRRILGADGKVKAVRWTATKDPAVSGEPVGTIDPFCKSVSFWNGETPLAVMTWYATHPQSHYGDGEVSADFVGMARAMREAALPGVPHIHFNGAGGNLGAGKWNDGAPENRPVLAARLADGMEKAWATSKRIPVDALEFSWAVEPVVLPNRKEINPDAEAARLASPDTSNGESVNAAWELAWIGRNNAQTPIELNRLRIGPVQLVQMPGELFVEYQIAAQDMAGNDFVCMAAYSDYGPGYIGTTVSYDEGGYETGLYTAHCGPEVEAVLMDGMRALLN